MEVCTFIIGNVWRFFNRVTAIAVLQFANECLYMAGFCSVMKHNLIGMELTVYEIPTCGLTVIHTGPLKAASNIARQWTSGVVWFDMCRLDHPL
jgi:hypothetical protein